VSPLLSIRGITRRFSGLTALEDVSFDVNEGQVVGLIGPNGAGKTTMINVITGITPPTSGDVLLRGSSLVGLRPDAIARKGVGRTFQHIRLFGELSVVENVMVGLDTTLTYGYIAASWALAHVGRAEEQARARALEILQRVDPMLRKRSELRASSLPYADKRRLEIARALALNPSLLLLDEPAAGMAPREMHALAEDLKRLEGHGTALILIEHKMRLIEGVTQNVVVLDRGRKIFEGPFEEVQKNPDVVKAYLGGGYGDAAVAAAD
jgi:ABC-type branched-subunit amino acid transport system ATPase component